jgi:drug/metabolite transporter (DMT)-like permease
MTEKTPTGASAQETLGGAPIKGAASLLLSSALFSVTDMAAAILNRSMSGLETTWFRYSCFALVMVVLFFARSTGARRIRRPGLQLARGACISGAAVLFIVSLETIPLSVATAINFVSPLLIVALSAIVLRERVGAVRWAAVAVGFIGVVIIIRPSIGAYGWATLLPLGAAACWAAGMIVTRRVGAEDDVIVTVACSAVIGFLWMSCLQPFVWHTPSLPMLLLGLSTGFVAVGAQLALASAYRWADASLVAPLSYSQLLWAIGFDAIVLKHTPDAMTLIGASLVIASGLANVYFGHRLFRTAQPAPPASSTSS